MTQKQQTEMSPADLWTQYERAEKSERSARENQKLVLHALKQKGISTFKAGGRVLQIRLRNGDPHLVVLQDTDELPAV